MEPDVVEVSLPCQSTALSGAKQQEKDVMSDYVIGIGGTGARCVESLIHLCAAGLGPERLFPVLIDPDGANGNLRHTTQLIDGYLECRSALGGANLEIFGTEIVSPKLEAGNLKRHWSPLEDMLAKDPTSVPCLNSYFGYTDLDKSSRDVCRLLYSEAELTENLTRGFLGHPNIGAPVMTVLTEQFSKQPFDSLIERIQSDLGAAGQPARVFVIASAFGGTGASGFPVLARILVDEAKNWTQRSMLTIGGALALPYFFYMKPDDSQHSFYADPENFLVNTRAALIHYSQLGPEINSYDTIYYIGEGTLSEVEPSSGGRDQKNPSHYVELLGALAALDFFTQPLPETEKKPKTKQKYLGRHLDSEVSWHDLPNLGTKLVRENLLYFSTFAIAGLTFGFPLLKHLDDDLSNERFLPWYIDHFIRGELVSDAEKTCLGHLRTYLQDFLEWCCQLSNHPPVQVKLFNNEALRSLKNSGFSSIDDFLFRNFLADRGGAVKNGFDSIWNTMCSKKKSLRPQYQSPLGRFVALLYDAAKYFCRENYKIETKR